MGECIMISGGWTPLDRDIQRQKETERHTEIDRDRQRQTETDRHTDSERDRETHRETDRDLERDREIDRDRERDRQSRPYYLVQLISMQGILGPLLDW